MKAGDISVSREWLALREPADAAARARDLADQLQRDSSPGGDWLIHDLGGGTGAMGRWLAPRLAGTQQWVIHERDEDLLALAATVAPPSAADGAAVTIEGRRSDITRLDARDLAGATLVTASALLDMLTEHELVRLLGVCSGVGCPILLTLSVVGRVIVHPADRLDPSVTEAFNAHQRRVTERGRLLGPDAVAFAVEELGRLGAEVLVRPSPWQLGAEHTGLIVEWLAGWVGAASEQQPELAPEIDVYRSRRLEQLAAGGLTVVVDHADLLALPR